MLELCRDERHYTDSLHCNYFSELLLQENGCYFLNVFTRHSESVLQGEFFELTITPSSKNLKKGARSK